MTTILSKVGSMSYIIELAVKATNEFDAIQRLQDLGLSKADEAKLSDLDEQADLFIIKVSTSELELTDIVYKKLLDAKDISILADELSAERAREIISLTNKVEDQLKKLLIYVLPETESVMMGIIETHQDKKKDFIPTDRIEWCRKIKGLSFGNIPYVLQEDIADFAKKQLLSEQGLVSLISTAKDFEEFKTRVAEISKSKTVWDSINSILDKPVDYNYISGSINYLCNARNGAAHLETITKKQLHETTKNQKHLMSHIGNVKSDYRDSLSVTMKSLSNSMKSLVESVVKFDSSFFTDYQKNINEMFKPVTETVKNLQLNISSPDFSETIRNNVDYQSQIAESFAAVMNNLKVTDEYAEAMKKISQNGFTQVVESYAKEVKELRICMDKSANKNQIGVNNE